MRTDKVLIESEEDVKRTVSHLGSNLSKLFSVPTFRMLQEEIEDIQRTLKDSPALLKVVIWEKLFTWFGLWALQELGLDLNVSAFAHLLKAKHDSYGPKPINNWGPLGIVIRVSSKLGRYERLRDNPGFLGRVRDESLQDTVADVLGYAVLGLRYLEVNKNG